MIHKTAIISQNAKIGNNVKIGPYSIIGDRVVISDNVEIKSHVVIDGMTTIGENNVIFPFASIGSQPQDLKYLGEDSEVIIGNNNSIREYVTIQPATKGGDKTIIGDDNLLMVGVHIAHDCVIGNNCIFANYASLAGHVEVGDYVLIGGLSAVLQFTKIGKHSVVGGLSGLDKDLIPYGLANADRANLEGLNLLGLKRRGFDKAQSLEASNVIKEIFNNNNALLFNDRVAKAKNDYPNNQIIQDIVEFLANDGKKFCRFKLEKI